MIYRLSGNDLVVEVPLDQIRYNRAYLPTQLNLLPNFGAAGVDETGYMLVPEGGGALINYNNGKLQQNSYYANIYGWDYARSRKEVVNETRAVFPAFGMTGAQGAFMCMLEDGASYASIAADISGHTNSYNTVNAVYTLLHGEAYEVSAKTTASVYIFESKMPKGTLKQRYRFIDSPSYVDMAVAYREYLLAAQPELKPLDDADMPLAVDFVGAIDKTVQKMGVPVSTPVCVTSFQRAGELMEALHSQGLKNLSVQMSGWCNRGIKQNVLTRINLVPSLGTESDLRAMLAKGRELGVDVYLDGVTQFAYDSDLFDGFIAFRDAARFPTREKSELYNYSNLWYGQEDYEDSYYLVKPSYSLDMMKNLATAVSGYGAAGVAYRDYGYLLSADYNANDLVTREEHMALQRQAVDEAQAGGLKVAVKKGNSYALSDASIVTDMVLRGSDYSIIDTLIPFYQIALHGYVRYTGDALNLSGDYRQGLLEAAEYGAGLSFTFMDSDATVLRDSYYFDLYGAPFDEWGTKAAQLATEYQQQMAGLAGKRIVGHEAITDTLRRTDYENGASVYVNYGNTARTVDGLTVQARSYAVKEGH